MLTFSQLTELTFSTKNRVSRAQKREPWNRKSLMQQDKGPDIMCHEVWYSISYSNWLLFEVGCFYAAAEMHSEARLSLTRLPCPTDYRDFSLLSCFYGNIRLQFPVSLTQEDSIRFECLSTVTMWLTYLSVSSPDCFCVIFFLLDYFS